MDRCSSLAACCREATTWLLLGRTSLELGELQPALSCLMQAVALQPDHEEGRWYLALGLLAMFEEGERSCSRVDSVDDEGTSVALWIPSTEAACRPDGEAALVPSAEAVVPNADPQVGARAASGWAGSVRCLLRLPENATEALPQHIERWCVSELERWRRNGVQSSMHPLPAVALTDCSMWPPLSGSLGLGCSSVPQFAAALLMLARIHARRGLWSALFCCACTMGSRDGRRLCRVKADEVLLELGVLCADWLSSVHRLGGYCSQYQAVEEAKSRIVLALRSIRGAD